LVFRKVVGFDRLSPNGRKRVRSSIPGLNPLEQLLHQLPDALAEALWIIVAL